MNVQFKSHPTFSNSRGSYTKIFHNAEEKSFHCMLILRCVHNWVLFCEILNKATSRHFPGNRQNFCLMDIRWKKNYLCTFRIGFKFGELWNKFTAVWAEIHNLTTKRTVVQYYKKVHTNKKVVFGKQLFRISPLVNVTAPLGLLTVFYDLWTSKKM